MSAKEKTKRAVFVDRDGTLIEEVNFLATVDDLVLFPFTTEAVALLKQNGYLVIVVTNQSGIGRGLFSRSDMDTVHDEIQKQLSSSVDAFYFCPHLPDSGCCCRKPNLGMIENACNDFNIDLSRSWMVGDKALDIETGQNAGMRSVMVLTGYGTSHSGSLMSPPDIIVPNLLEAARLIVAEDSVPA